MLNIIMQGDQYSVPVVIKAMNGETISNENAVSVRVKIGNKAAYWPEGGLTYRAEDGVWLFPLAQEDTYRMMGTKTEYQAQAKFVSGEIFSSVPKTVPVGKSVFHTRFG